MQEADISRETELYSCDGFVTAVRNSTRLQILRAIREKGEITFPELQKMLGLSKSTVSTYLNSLDDSGVICRITDPHDSRKKIYRLAGTYLGKIDPTTYSAPTEFRELIRQSYTNYDKIHYKDILPHIFRVALAESGISINPVLTRGGTILGEAVAPYVVSDSLERTVDNIVEFWAHYDFGEIQVSSLEPVTLDVYKCYECMILPKGIDGGCVISKGILSALFSAFYQVPVLVNELCCMTQGDEFCRYVIVPKPVEI